MAFEAERERLQQVGVVEVRSFDDVGLGLDYAQALYDKAIGGIHELIRSLNRGERPNFDRRNAHWGYPVLAVPMESIPPSRLRQYHRKSFGWPRAGKGIYASEVTNPGKFRAYFLQQLAPLLEDFKTELLVGRSQKTMIPIDFALNGSGLELNVGKDVDDVVWKYFWRPRLEKTNWDAHFAEERPNFWRLAHYEALPTDLALHRFLHYTGTMPEYCQNFVFFTNFAHHLRVFQQWGREMAESASGCIGVKMSPGLEGATNYYDLPAHPAVHVMWPDRMGITMINVGVGAPNILKVVDCIAPLRPYCVILLGICGGLRQTQRQGMFVLAQGFVGDSPIAGDLGDESGTVNGEIQQALRLGICERLGIAPDDPRAKEAIEKAQIVTTSNRGWEFRHDLIARYTGRIAGKAAKAGAIEMESQATIGACEFHTIPAAFCGILSDVPVEGDFRLPGSSASFFRANVESHVMAAVNAWRRLRGNPDSFQSRLLRANDFQSPLR